MPIQTTAVTRLGISGGIWNRLGGDYSNKAASPPVFTGTIPDITGTEGDSNIITDLSSYFSGATSYSIAPAVEAGWDFDTVTGILTVDTDAAGTFGTYVVTGTNAAGSDDSNAFSVVISEAAAETGSGYIQGKRKPTGELPDGFKLGLMPAKMLVEKAAEQQEVEPSINLVDALMADLVEQRDALQTRAEQLEQLGEAQAQMEQMQADLRLFQELFEGMAAEQMRLDMEEQFRIKLKARREEEERVAILAVQKYFPHLVIRKH